MTSTDIQRKYMRLILLVLLIFATVALRFQHTNQTDFDSYWLHGMAESIQLHGSALWVFHPASLFGYYPLSYPSGTAFFLADAGTLMGLDMNTTVFFTSILLGVAIVFLTFMLGKRVLNSWTGGYIAAFIISFSPIITNYTDFNSGGRILVMIFYIPMIWALLTWHQTKKKSYLVLSGILLLFAFFTHRTSQLTIVFILAFLGALFYEKIPNIWKYIREHKHYKKYIQPRYEKSKYFLLLDLGVIVFLMFGAKIADLIARGRLGNNLTNRVVTPAVNILLLIDKEWIIFVSAFGVLFLLGLGTAIYVKIIKKKKIIKSILNFLHYHYHQIFVSPQKYFLFLLLLFTAVIFVRQFFGQSFYAPSLQEYYTTELLSGDAPWIVFGNLMINYTTSVTPLFILYFAGFMFILFKKEKRFADWFVIFSFIGFSGVLLDKRYVRMFITPFISILIGYSIIFIFNWLNTFSRRKKLIHTIKYALPLAMLILVIGGAYIPYLRSTSSEQAYEDQFYLNLEPYWQTGQYIRQIDCGECSTITTDEQIAGVVIFASSGVPGASHNIYYYVDRDKIKPVALSFKQIKDKIKAGEKVDDLWILPDWIFGGQYYLGRHARYLFDRPFYDKINKVIIEDYKEKYYIHDKNLDENAFLNSIKPVKNIIYNNPQAEVYQLNRGRE